MAGRRHTRALLDELMGKARNEPLNKSSRHKFHWSDRNFCSHYLCGWCPIREFDGTKVSLGTCPFAHNEIAKVQFEKERWGKQQYTYEKYRTLLLKIKSEYEFRTRRSNDILLKQLTDNTNNADNANKVYPETADDRALKNVQEKIPQLLKKVEKFGEEGNIEKSQKVLAQIELLKKVAKDLENQIRGKRIAQGNARLYSNFKVCKICGGLQDQDPESLASHNVGIIHLGFIRYHQELERVSNLFQEKGIAIEEEDGASEGRSRSRSYNRGRGRGRSGSSGSRSSSESSRSRSRSPKRKSDW